MIGIAKMEINRTTATLLQQLENVASVNPREALILAIAYIRTGRIALEILSASEIIPLVEMWVMEDIMVVRKSKEELS